MSLTKLTEWESGEPCYVDVSRIVSMRRLPAPVSELLPDRVRELGGRTRIDTQTDMLLVRETPEEILALAANPDPEARDERQ